MALITGSTIIRSLSLFHITLAFFFLTNPKTISDQTIVFIMGEAMGLVRPSLCHYPLSPLKSALLTPLAQPHTRTFDVTSPPLSLLSIVLFLHGISDLVSISLTPAVSLPLFAAQAPIRLFFFFVLGLYSFLFSARSPMYKGQHYVPSSWGEGLKNRVVFTLAFVEMISWFWVWTTLREERREMALREAERRRKEEDML
jgi:hypothetical protein